MIREKLRKKLHSRAGESIAETLVALLIAALALVMLAGAISAASAVVTRSREKLNDYYTANEEAGSVVKMGASSYDPVPGGISISGTINKSYTITYYVNDKFGKTPVISYKKVPE